MTNFIRDYPDHYLGSLEATWSWGDCARQKQWKEAQAAYERLLTLYPKSPWAGKPSQFIVGEIANSSRACG
jgi:hypothetical protein